MITKKENQLKMYFNFIVCYSRSITAAMHSPSFGWAENAKSIKIPDAWWNVRLFSCLFLFGFSISFYNFMFSKKIVSILCLLFPILSAIALSILLSISLSISFFYFVLNFVLCFLFYTVFMSLYLLYSFSILYLLKKKIFARCLCIFSKIW